MNRNKILLAIVALVVLAPIIYFLIPKDELSTQPKQIPQSNIANLSITNVIEHPHDTAAFTEGLEFVGNKLWEGTGLEKQSFIAETDMETKKQIIKYKNPADFGEGITVLNGTLYQLTYKEGKAYSYLLECMCKPQVYPFKPEGWGLTNDGKSLIASNGTADVTYYNPATFTKERTIQVSDNMGLVNNINELEFVDGFIYANIYGTNSIVKFDAANGKIVARLDATSLRNKLGNAPGINEMNGIAYNKTKKTFFLTGKNWPKMFEVVLQ